MTALYPDHTVLVCSDAARRTDAAGIAARLGIACVDTEPADSGGMILRLTTEHLELQLSGADAPGPIRVEFTTGRTGWRGRKGNTRDEALARAARVRRESPPHVIDATAGLGRDAFVLASLGCEVVLIERHPVVAALLRDGLRRAADAPDTREAAGRMTLLEGDARELLAGQRAEVVLVDPMHPPRRKDTAVKKEMRIFRQLVGTDPDAGELLRAALHAASRRVVVKRPRGAKPVAGPSPSGAVEGRSTRFDIYAGSAQ